jgi:hypothetical protein
MAATRSLTVLRALVAIDNAARADLAADVAFFAALRFVVMVPISLVQRTLGKSHIVVIESLT